MSKETIVVIENQISQYFKIHEYLNPLYTVYPSDEHEFKTFMNCVRIYLNERFGELNTNSYRDIALKEMYSILEDLKLKDLNISLFILDYVLVGNHDGKDGIFLAQTLREKFVTTPIIFLSRTNRSYFKVMRDYSLINEPVHWIEKGYFQRRNLSEDYFKKNVLKIIKKYIDRIPEFEIEHMIAKLESMPKDRDCENYSNIMHEIYKEIRQHDYNFDLNLKEELKILSNRTYLNDNVIKAFKNKWKQNGK